MRSVDSTASLDELDHFSGLRVTARSLLRVDEIAIDLNLEESTAGWYELQRLDLLSESVYEFGRQTDGPVCVVSDHAELKPDLHISPRVRVRVDGSRAR
jgi:hypothetical protein